MKSEEVLAQRFDRFRTRFTAIGREVERAVIGQSPIVEQVLLALEHPSASGLSAPRPARDKLGDLSRREREVLDCVLEGKPSRQIAEELYISVKTVEFHRARIMQKLGVRSAAELFRYCLAP